MADLTLFEALTSGAFDCLNSQQSGEFDQNFSKKSNAPGFAWGGGGGGWAVLELTNTLITSVRLIQVGNNRNDHFKYFSGVRVHLIDSGLIYSK